jgi:ribosome-associated translation inhibitor RaiA
VTCRDIVIIFDQDRVDIDKINSYMNQIYQHLEFTPNIEENNNITYLDIQIHANTHKLHIGLHRKPTQTDITIHFTSNHPLQHKLAAYHFYINRMHSLPITTQAKQQEWITSVP